MTLFKAIVDIKLRESVLDSEGSAIERGLKKLDFLNVKKVNVGKTIELLLEADSREKAEEEVKEMCEKLLVNLVVENYSFEIMEV